MSPLWQTIAIWAALSATACGISTWWLIRANKRASHLVVLAIESMGETHRTAFTVLTLEIDKLKRRVDELEPTP